MASNFVEYQATRARKAPEALASAKDWQPAGRRLYLPLDVKAYGLGVRTWEGVNSKGKKCKKHAITWKAKPFARLLLNKQAGAKEFARVEVNTDAGLAVQVDPANFKRVYVSIPAGALDAFPADACMLEFKQGKDGAWTLCAK